MRRLRLVTQKGTLLHVIRCLRHFGQKPAMSPFAYWSSQDEEV
jgi:hypothetical protein